MNSPDAKQKQGETQDVLTQDSQRPVDGEVSSQQSEAGTQLEPAEDLKQAMNRAQQNKSDSKTPPDPNEVRRHQKNSC